MSFNNKVAIVTGASSGIGAAIAVKLSKEGAQVVMVGRNQTKLQNVSNVCKTNGKEPLTVIAEMTNEDDVRKIVSETVTHFQKIDILVNNAGLASLGRLQDQNAMEVFDNLMALNLRSVVQLTHLAVPYLIESKGNIINISSIAALKPVAGFAYNCSKAALDHFARTIALELAPKGVRVNNINPGPIRTDMIENMGYPKDQVAAIYQGVGKTLPLQRVADAEEVADLVVYMASDKGKSITGSMYVIDCGDTLK